MMNNRVIENEGESEREKGESPPHLIQYILRCRKTDRQTTHGTEAAGLSL